MVGSKNSVTRLFSKSGSTMTLVRRSLQRDTTAAAWTEGMLLSLRALVKTLFSGFASGWSWIEESGLVVGFSIVGWVLRTSQRTWREVTCSAGWPLLKQWTNKVRFSSARDCFMLAFDPTVKYFTHLIE